MNTKKYLAKPYTRMLAPDEDGVYVAEVLELPGCISQGATPTKALANLEEAMEGWIEVALADGRPIPEPMAEHEYSGNLRLRMPAELHRRAALYARRDGVSLNQWIVAAIAEKVGASSRPAEAPSRSSRRSA